MDLFSVEIAAGIKLYSYIHQQMDKIDQCVDNDSEVVTFSEPDV